MSAPRILLVEDSPAQAEALRGLLGDAGFDLTVAPNGDKALQTLATGNFALVIADVVMPGAVDGYEFCRQVKAKAGKDVPVMLLTSLSEPMDIIRGLESGADNFLTRPYDPDRLLERVNGLLQTRQARHQAKVCAGVHVQFMGHEYVITSEREQILDLLVTTFEDAVRQNAELRLREEQLLGAEAALSRRAGSLEHRLQGFIDSSPLPIVGVDLDGLVSAWNPSAERTFGWSRHEALGRADPSVPDSDRAHYDALLRAALDGQIRDSVDVPRWRKDGTPIQAVVSMAPLRDHGDEVVGAYAILADVSDRRRAETALRASEARFRRVVDSNMAGILFWDVTGDVTDANDAFLSIVGHTRAELERHAVNWRHLTPPEWAASDARALEELDAAGRCTPFEKEYVRPDGTRVPVLVAAATFEDRRDGGVAFVLDISDRRAAEAAQRESDERYRVVTETAQDAIITIDEDSTIQFANPAADATFGYPPGSLVGRPLADLMPSRFWTEHRSGVARYAVTGRRGADWRRNEFIGRRRTGEEFPLEVSLAESSHQGRRYFTGVLRDITERKRAEAAVRTSELRYRDLFDGAPVGLYRTLPDGTIVDANPALVQLLGFPSREALLATRVEDLLPHPERRREWERDLATQGFVDRLELEIRRFDSTTIVVQDQARIVRDPQGNLAYYEGALMDVTDQRRVEQSLRETQESYRLLLDSSGEGIYGIDLAGNCTFCSVRALHLLGFAHEDEILGRNIHEVIHARRLDGTPYPVSDCPIHRAVRTGVPVHVTDEVFWRTDGTPLPVEYRAHPLRQSGRTAGAVVSFSDVSEERALEDQLRQAQKMEAVGRLAGGIAHDFNNLLTVILGESDFALADIPSDSPARRSLKEVHQAGVRASVLTRQLLAFSRRQLTATRNLDLNQLVTDLDSIIRRLIGEDVRVATQVSSTPLQVCADPGHLEQVLINLVVNARDAMPQGGDLIIETSETTLDQAFADRHPGIVPGPYAILTVSDTGSGMSDEVQSHIFEPFFTTKEQGKGTGLGLATSYGIIRQFGGHISVHSELGVGTAMRIFLPLVARQAGAVSAAAEPVPHGTETVLLVEDEERVRRTVARMLRGLGYRVLDAGSGPEALNLISTIQAPIHLLLTDVVLPGMGGREVAERVQALRPEVRVLFASGYTDDVILQHRLQSTDVSLIQKPFSPGALARKIRDVLDA